MDSKKQNLNAFLLAEILIFQRSTHFIGVGSLSSLLLYWIKEIILSIQKR